MIRVSSLLLSCLSLPSFVLLNLLYYILSYWHIHYCGTKLELQYYWGADFSDLKEGYCCCYEYYRCSVLLCIVILSSRCACGGFGHCLGLIQLPRRGLAMVQGWWDWHKNQWMWLACWGITAQLDQLRKQLLCSTRSIDLVPLIKFQRLLLSRKATAVFINSDNHSAVWNLPESCGFWSPVLVLSLQWHLGCSAIHQDT